MEFDDGDPEPVVEGIPLADEESAKPPKASPKVAAATRTPSATSDKGSPSAKPTGGKEDDAIAQFLLDLKLEDDE